MVGSRRNRTPSTTRRACCAALLLRPPLRDGTLAYVDSAAVLPDAMTLANRATLFSEPVEHSRHFSCGR